MPAGSTIDDGLIYNSSLSYCLFFLPVDNPGLIITTKDLSNVVPLKKQLGFFGMVSEILNKLGEQDVASSFHSPILQIMLSLLSTCVLALEQRDMVSQLSELQN